MKSMAILASAVACAIVGLTGCGGGHHDDPPPLLSTQILSDPSIDGDIEQFGANSFTITQGTEQSVLAGINPADPNNPSEFRAFLDFPLGGPAGVPGQAVINSATLEIFIDDLQPQGGAVPLLIDLVNTLPRLELRSTDYDRSALPALASVQTSAREADVGHSIMVDVTALMVQAQRQGLGDFQIRILQDLVPNPVPTVITIDDTTGSQRPKFAPLLTVEYF
jgi:hypothetical protein